MAHQERSIGMLVLVAFGMLAVVDVASATEYGVGGDVFGWTIPTKASMYEDWVAERKFVTNDVLVFQYLRGAHNVLHVTKAAYENCTITDPIDKFESGNDKITLVDSEYYFICGISIHCTLNQKINVTVTKSAIPSPVAKDIKPTPSALTPAPSPGSSASGLQAAGALICSVLMGVVASVVL